MTDASRLPAAGWYPDPENPAGERWWNGASWSDQKRGGPAAVPPVPPAPAGYTAPPTADQVYTGPPTGQDAGLQYGSAYAQAGQPTGNPQYAPQPYASQPYASQPYGATPASSSNGLAIAGLVVSCVSLLIGLYGLTAIAGIVLSALGLRQANQKAAAGLLATGRGVAIAGIVVGAASALLNVVVLVVIFAVTPSIY